MILKMIKKKKQGVAALITVLSMGGLIFTIALGAVIIAYFANQNILSFRNSTRAFYASQSGLQDALLKLERNKDYRDSFNLSIDGVNNVTVSFAEFNPPREFAIISTSTFAQSNTRIQVIVEIDDTTGLITPTSTSEQMID